MSSQSAKGLLSIRAYAFSRKERGLPGGTHQAVRKAIASSRITLVAGKIDPDAADYQWSTNTAPSTRPNSHPQQAPTAATEGNGGAAESSDYVAARMRTEKVRAQLLEVELAEKNGVLIDAERVRRATFEKARIARDALMSIPARLSAQVAAETDQMKVHDLMTVEIHRICAELATESPLGDPPPTH